MGFRSPSRRALAGALAVLVLFPLLRADTKPALTPEQRQKNLESFDYVWKTVKDKHWDPKHNGVDWEAVRQELRPKAEQAATTADARALMGDMLKRLGQSHFGIIPRDAYQALEKVSDPAGKKSGERGEGTTGLDLRVVDGQALVVKVEDDSPAAQLGVKPGWVIAKVRDQEMAALLERALKALKDSPYLELRLARAVESRLTGTVGEKLAVVFRDGEDRDVSLELPLAKPKGRPTTFGHMPATVVRLEARRLDSGVGYIFLNTFFDPVNVSREFREAVFSKPAAEGIILDLRGNPGGLGGMAMGMGNLFVEKADQKLGTMALRNGTINFVLNPQAETFRGPLAVLVDGCSASTSEILAGGLQGLKRARIFGTRTAGAALPSLIERLPNGDGFQFAIANYVAVDGKVLEGAGVQPDEEVKPQRKALLAGRDPVVDAAVKWIKASKQLP